MVEKVFVDTVAWIALINKSDVLHTPARQQMSVLRQQNARLITTEFVLLEVADALSEPNLRSSTVTYLDGLRKLTVLQIVPASSALFAAGWTRYSQRPDKEWGLTDCTSFIVMEQEEITQVFTSDRHFEQAGFVKLI